MKIALCLLLIALGLASYIMSLVYVGQGEYAHACWLWLVGNMNYESLNRMLRVTP